MSHDGAEGNGQLLIAHSARRAFVCARAALLVSWLHLLPSVYARQLNIAAI